MSTAVATTVLAYLPSPDRGVWYIGPLPIRAYALCIIAGIVVAVLWGERRWTARGGARADSTSRADSTGGSGTNGGDTAGRDAAGRGGAAHGLRAVHALRGPTFAGLQFRPESVLSEDGMAVLHALLTDLVPAAR